jgi:hypothetical protein
MKEMGKILGEVFQKEKKEQIERKRAFQRVMELGYSCKLYLYLL